MKNLQVEMFTETNEGKFVQKVMDLKIGDKKNMSNSEKVKEKIKENMKKFEKSEKNGKFFYSNLIVEKPKTDSKKRKAEHIEEESKKKKRFNVKSLLDYSAKVCNFNWFNNSKKIRRRN